MKAYWYVGLGGAIGSLLRYFVSLITIYFFGNGFPYGTLCVNLLGAFLLGWFTTHILYRKNPALAAAIGTGMIGSFTTLSTLSVDLVFLLERAAYISALIYIIISIFAGLFFAYAGLQFGKKKVVTQ